MDHTANHESAAGSQPPSRDVPAASFDPELLKVVVADAERPTRRILRNFSLDWMTDMKSGAETAYGLGGFRYRIYTTEEFGTCCMYMWPGHSITTYYESHDAGKMAMNDHYEALCQIRDEGARDALPQST